MLIDRVKKAYPRQADLIRALAVVADPPPNKGAVSRWYSGERVPDRFWKEKLQDLLDARETLGSSAIGELAAQSSGGCHV